MHNHEFSNKAISVGKIERKQNHQDIYDMIEIHSLKF